MPLPCRRRGLDEQLRAFAGLDLLLQRPRNRMPIGLHALGMRLEHAQRLLGIASVGGTAGVGQRHAQCALVVLGHAVVGGAGLGVAPCLVGQKRPVEAQIILGPVGLLGRVEEGQRLLGFVLRLIEPGAGQRARQLTDGIGAGRLEVLVGRLVALRLEVGQAQERVRHAVRRLRQSAPRQLLAARPVALHQLHQERLLHQHVVAGSSTSASR